MPEHNYVNSRLPDSDEAWQRVFDYASECKEHGTPVFTIERPVENMIVEVYRDDDKIERKSRNAKKGSNTSFVFKRDVVKLWTALMRGERNPPGHLSFAKALVYEALQEFVELENGLGLRSSVEAVLQSPAPPAATQSSRNEEPGNSGTSQRGARAKTLPQLIDDLNRQVEVGEAGEAIALSYEVERLRALGIKCPEGLVEQVSKTDSSAGFDLKSDGDGGRCIEVKSSTSPHGRFYITANELKTLTELEDKAFLYFVHVRDVDNQQGGVLGEIRDPGKSVLDKDNLEAVAFRSTIPLSVAAAQPCDVTNGFHPGCAPVGRDPGP